MMAAEQLLLAGFTSLSDRIYLRNGYETPNPPLHQEPTTVVIFGWGDGVLKHVSKYADGYQKIFPRARTVLVLSRTLQASTQSVESRIEAMMPVIDTVFPSPLGNGNEPERVLLHAMSNTGGVFLAATFAAYQQRHGSNRKVPFSLLVCDSTPGSLNFASQVSRWSWAMAVGTSKYFLWPFTITRVLWYIILWANWAWERLRGIEPSGVWAVRLMNDPAIAPVESGRLYLYSKEDKIIWWEDLVQAAAQAKSIGYKADLEMFEGSPHVGHMRLYPDQYWKKVLSAWKETQSRH